MIQKLFLKLWKYTLFITQQEQSECLRATEHYKNFAPAFSLITSFPIAP